MSDNERTDWVWRHRWKLLMLWIVVFTTLVFFGLHQNRVLASKGDQAHDAICVLKADYRSRIKQSKEFLRDNPHGTPGFSSKVINNSIRNMKLTLHSLGSVHCKGDPNA